MSDVTAAGETEGMVFARQVARTVITCALIIAITWLGGCVIDNYFSMEAAKAGLRRQGKGPAIFVPVERPPAVK